MEAFAVRQREAMVTPQSPPKAQELVPQAATAAVLRRGAVRRYCYIGSIPIA
jgi:hypothetical protein